MRDAAVPPLLALLPASAPAAHSWNASFEVAPLYLAPTLVTAAAAEIDRSDPDRVALCPHLSFRDPLIEKLGRSFVG